MERVIGIDLGTTNCCVAWVEGGRPRVIADEKGYNIQPSYIAVKGPGKYIVGLTAKAQAISSPHNTINAVKRIIGRKYGSPEVEEVKKRVLYDIIDGPNHDVLLRAGGVTLTPVEASSILLKNLKGIAEKALNQEISNAVITVPAYFNHAQRKATIEAGEKSGLKVLRLLNEPTSAALAYGFRKELSKRLLVFDLGGGTFDVSVLEVGNDVYEVLVTNGDSYLGGEDFDQVIVGHLADRFEEAHGVDLREDKTAMQRLKDGAERAKCELSFTDRTQILIPQIHGRTNLQVEMTRATLEALVEPLIRRCMDVARKTLDEADLRPKDVDEILLVGGQPRMPRIQEEIRTLFGKPASKGVHPDEAVAIGAAVHASVLSEDTGSMLLLDVTPFSLGIDSAGDVFTRIVPKNATIPVSEKRTFTTVHDNQETVRIVVRQGESRKSSENVFLGEFILSGIRKAPRMEPKIDVTFRIDSNGILNVTARDRVTAERQSISIRDYPERAFGGGGPGEREEERETPEAPTSSAAGADKEKKGISLFKRLTDSLRRPKKPAAPAAPPPDSAVMMEPGPGQEEGEAQAAPPADLSAASAAPVHPIPVPESAVEMSSPAQAPPADTDVFGFRPRTTAAAPDPFGASSPEPAGQAAPAAPGVDLSDLENALRGFEMSVMDLVPEEAAGQGLMDLDVQDLSVDDLAGDLPLHEPPRGGMERAAPPPRMSPPPAAEPFGLTDRELDPFELADLEVEPFDLAEKASEPFGLTEKPAEPFGLTGKASEPFGLTGKASEPFGLTEKPAEPFGLTEKPAEPFGLTEKASEPFGLTEKASEPFGLTEKPAEPFGVREREPSAPSAVAAAPVVAAPQAAAPQGAEPFGLTSRAPDPYGLTPRAAGAAPPPADQDLSIDLDFDEAFAVQERSPGAPASSPGLGSPSRSVSQELEALKAINQVGETSLDMDLSGLFNLDTPSGLAAVGPGPAARVGNDPPSSPPVELTGDEGWGDEDDLMSLITRRQEPEAEMFAQDQVDDSSWLAETTGSHLPLVKEKTGSTAERKLGAPPPPPAEELTPAGGMGRVDDLFDVTFGTEDERTPISHLEKTAPAPASAYEDEAPSGGAARLEAPPAAPLPPPPPAPVVAPPSDAKVVAPPAPGARMIDPFSVTSRRAPTQPTGELDDALDSAFDITEGEADPFGIALKEPIPQGKGGRPPSWDDALVGDVIAISGIGGDGGRTDVGSQLGDIDSFLSELTGGRAAPVIEAPASPRASAPVDPDALVADIMGPVAAPVSPFEAEDALGRKPAQLKISYKRAEAFVLEARENLKRGGAFIKTAKPLENGRRCVFELTVPGLAEPVRLLGVVRWSSRGLGQLPPGKEHGMDVEYLFSTPADRRELEGLIQRLS